MQLCDICNAANGNAFEKAIISTDNESDNGESKSNKCYICGNLALQTDKMLAKATELLSAEMPEAGSFSISSNIPKDWIVREDRVWDEKFSKKTESIKNSINRRIISSLAKATNKTYKTDAEYRIIFDYKNGKISTENGAVFVFGRYKKIVVGLSQSRWKCNKCEGDGCEKCDGKGKYYESIEERIGDPLKAAYEANDYVLHASGREDVDATNSAGRIFVIEIKNPKKRNVELDRVTKEIETGKEVSVSDLRAVPRKFVEIITESHFDKSYKAGIEFGKEISKEDIEKITGLTGKTLLQKTPKRVAHRRAILVRHRKIKDIGVLESGGRNAIVLVTAEAGTYIKELISGDDGRTEPSIAALLSTSAKCTSLDVASIDDGFIDFIIEKYV
ncbi:tRNA pseudouridine(54/55) synthase Pus10 [Candidatus Micrarchaeota archaeon]|nr:tRNA pseudouridine(54/55) synthase Pus10 [Candidatus Micrarchaeota archaeon]MBU1166150.1 tRNA pseudouridine(54/55) synthase Pus10 [Candidatus Micrarchaeota archaeon]MBU1887306.1 tRNA pseudouridine(54/55) synthase Pus10 [Candidatus Micrarchaeota archaeon]